MPPKAQSQRRITQSQSDQVYELGVQGRKTGLRLEERPRDENGFEAVDDLFSSPSKDEPNGAVNGRGVNGRGRAESDEEQDMEIDDASVMGPATALKQRQNRPSLPRARSPIKTHLQSPARQNPHLGPSSSPTRGSIVATREASPPQAVNRKLDFVKISQSSSQNRMKPSTNGQPKVNGAKARNGKLTNGHAPIVESDEEPRGKRRNPRKGEEEKEEKEEEEEEVEVEVGQEASIDVPNAGSDEVDPIDHDDQDDDLPAVPEPEPEEDEEPQPKVAKRRGRKPKSPIAQVEEAPARTETAEGSAKARRGRPAKTAQPAKQPEPMKKSPKRRRPEESPADSTEEQEQEEDVEDRDAKRQRTEKKEKKTAQDTSSKPAATKEKGKPGRKRKSSGVGVDSPVVQRGPPLPRGRGLVTLRREEENIMRTTRSGRLSYQPLKFWQGEHVVFDSAKQQVFEDRGRHFVMPAVKSVMRAAETSPEGQPRKRRGRPAKRSKPGRRSSAIQEEEVERDDWEHDPGTITGECIYWHPEHELQQQLDDDDLEVVEEELAISEPAIQFKDIKDATFRFAKTLTMPFFGSGIVDMPPGSEKRTKNSRKMQMVFFVHAGSVRVIVAQTEFRIGKGGMWFVPRGNHYSITNDSDYPARIFFAQGCEVLVQSEEPQGGTQE
ncbi:Mif2/CENP-C like-domain-containing protein [Durotheca rogersii]|uniref:Mif2/CENP-C like-domain-containing protein n=1 Tax=Durotheca rogersii TaxID=419775 RepID=UPI00221E90EA|nr:Mif2/CENP-C like-domain-containing protein [Durotheca rogersii]KAI5864281.1 Mif2/CENP-C like-domain-containing protein [Durotheca rogersii]